jgi:hypothetical protein
MGDFAFCKYERHEIGITVYPAAKPPDTFRIDPAGHERSPGPKRPL